MPRYRLTLEYAGTRYSGWQIQKNARTVQGELHRALGTRARRPAVRDLRLRPHRRRRPRARSGGRTSTAATLPPPASLIRASTTRCRRHQRARRRAGAAAVPRAPQRGGAKLPLSDRDAPDGVREAVRVVGARGSARSRRDAGRGGAARPASATSARSPTTTRTRQSTQVLVDDVSVAARRRARCSSASSVRTFSGRWSGGSSASSSRWARRLALAVAGSAALDLPPSYRAGIRLFLERSSTTAPPYARPRPRLRSASFRHRVTAVLELSGATSLCRYSGLKAPAAAPSPVVPAFA